MRMIPFFQGSYGLQTKDDPVRLKYDPETGLQFLAVAVNVDITGAARISRRKGYEKKVDGSRFHSFFVAGDYSLCVGDGQLLVVERDFTTNSLRSISADRQVSYQTVGDTIYYSNGVDNGCVVEKTTVPWAAGELVGPTTTRQFMSPPAGHLLQLFKGRMYIAQTLSSHNVIWYTEPFAYSHVDPARNFIPIEERCVTMTALPDSLVVGTTGGVYSYIGSTPDTFDVRKLSDAPVVAGTAVQARGDLLGGGETPGQVVLLFTHEGLCMVAQEGYFANITSRKIDAPKFQEGCAAVINDKYITCLYT